MEKPLPYTSIKPRVALVLAASILIIATASAAPSKPSPDVRVHNGRKWVKTADNRHYPRVRRYHPKRVTLVPPRRRYRNVWVVRPYGHRYLGYGHYRRDALAYNWLAFTAITLSSLDRLTEAQQREHEAAQVLAATAPVGESIRWSVGGASGSVTALREGTNDAGRVCREFRQQVEIGGKSEQAYGAACRQPDGSWSMQP